MNTQSREVTLPNAGIRTGEINKTAVAAATSAVVALASIVALFLLGPDAIFLSVIALFLGIVGIRGVEGERKSQLAHTAAVFGTTVGGLAVGWYLVILALVWYYF